MSYPTKSRPQPPQSQVHSAHSHISQGYIPSIPLSPQISPQQVSSHHSPKSSPKINGARISQNGVQDTRPAHPAGPRDQPLPYPVNSRDSSDSVRSTSSRASRNTRSSIPNILPTITFPKSTITNVETLLKYLKYVPERILLIDLRSRLKFEAAHIACQNIICIEPIVLRPKMTDSSLGDALVLSPDSEQRLYAARNQFELVVYYDEESRSNSYAGGPTSDSDALAIHYLICAIYDYAFEKPLKRPPCLLIGGLEAWMEATGDRLLIKQDPDVSKAASSSTYYPDVDVAAEQKWIDQVHEQLTSPKLPKEIPSRPYGSRKGSVASASSDPRKSVDGNSSAQYARDVGEYLRGSQSLVQTPYHSDQIKSYPQKPPNYPPQSYPTQNYPAPNYPQQQSSYTYPPPYPASAPSSAPVSQSVLATPQPPKWKPPPPPPPVAYAPQQLSQAPYGPNPGPVALPRQQGVPQSPQGPPRLTQDEFCMGLKNLGNTCYMNCIIQCLAGTSAVSGPFIDGSYRRYVNVNSKLGYKGVLAVRFAELVQAMYRQDVSFVAPVSLKDLSGRLRDTFLGNEQQDCQEFLTFILDGLHEDLNANGDKDRLKELTEAEERRREDMSVRVASTIEWERYLKSDFSLIVDTVQGQYQSRLRCLVCGYTSTTYNAFSFLSLPIPLDRRQVSLQDCFDLFTSEEILDGDDAWHCPRCKKPRRTLKALRISRLPQILIIHLKRFKQQGRWSDKLETFVRYPVNNLDLTKYWPEPNSQDLERLSKMPMRGQTGPFCYDLYGVANHFGSLKGGHYTAFVKKGRQGWCYFDDTRVSRNHHDGVVNKNAYVLFYQRVQQLR